MPAGPVLVQIKGCFFSKRCSTTEDEAHRAKVILLAFGVIAHHLDEDGRNKGHLLDLEALDSRQKHLEVELGEDYCFITVVDTFMSCKPPEVMNEDWVTYRNERLEPSRRCGSAVKGQAGPVHLHQPLCGLRRFGLSLG